MNEHETVFLKTAIDEIFINEAGRYLDCTGGQGGHAAELLARLGERGSLWICDYHMDAVNHLKRKFQDNKQVAVLHSRFSQIFDNLNFPFDGIVADLGISSVQLADPSLGIGFLQDEAPLDMRLDSALLTSAADILKTYSEAALADIFFYYGGESASRKIAAAIVYDRHNNKFYETAGALRDLCARVLGRYYRHKKIHAATKVFQALRIEVNQELEDLKVLLQKAPQFLNVDGRFAVISFHSGEDRLVKTCFKELAATPEFELGKRKAIKPEPEEIARNPRSRSARMRVLKKI